MTGPWSLRVASKLRNVLLASRTVRRMQHSMPAPLSHVVSDTHIVWLDLEMTGLSVDTCHILEIGCLITDKNLNVISDELNVIVHQPPHIIANMEDEARRLLEPTGLLAESAASKISLSTAETMLLTLLETHVPNGKCPLAGNTVYVDRMFLIKHMPRVDRYLHYRLIDVTTIKELAKRWNPRAVFNKDKPSMHRAMDDIKMSIKELKHYSACFLQSDDNLR